MPVKVSPVPVRQTPDPPAGLRQKIARPLEPFGFVVAVTVPGPWVEKVNVRARPARLPFWASRRIEVNVIEVRLAWGVGLGDGVGGRAEGESAGLGEATATGLELGPEEGAEDGPAEAPAIVVGLGKGAGAGPPLRTSAAASPPRIARITARVMAMVRQRSFMATA